MDFTQTENMEESQSSPVEVNNIRPLPKVSLWRAIREFFADARYSWSSLSKSCTTSWRCIRSSVLWCSILLTLNLLYWLFGGLLFASVEGWHESRYKCGALRIRRHFIDELWEQSSVLPEEEWRSLARQKLVDFEDQLHEAFSEGLTSYSGKRTWGFWDAVAFSMTTVATIGYGHIVPVTWVGRIATIFYSLFGIPLFLVLLADSGLLFTRILKFSWVLLLKFLTTNSGRRILGSRLVTASSAAVHSTILTLLGKLENRKLIGPVAQRLKAHLREGILFYKQTSRAFVIDDQFNIPAVAALALLLAYVLLGAGIFFFSEEWSPLESFYFVFISLTTIGFGDYVPQHPLALLTSVVYIIFGLALTGLCLNALQGELLQKSEQIKSRLCSMLNLELSSNEIVDLPALDVLDKEKPQ